MANKEAISEKREQLLKLTRGFCDQYLDEEYWAVIEKLINKMARKRTVPFLLGKIETWAAAVVYALGMVNSLFDRPTTPYFSAGDICAYFGTSQSTTTQKSKQIRDMFEMGYVSPEFATQHCCPQSLTGTWSWLRVPDAGGHAEEGERCRSDCQCRASAMDAGTLYLPVLIGFIDALIDWGRFDELVKELSVTLAGCLVAAAVVLREEIKADE